MVNRSERSLFFLLLGVAFVCLLLSGGSRLIGVQGEEETGTDQALVRAVLVSAPAPNEETGATQRLGHSVQRRAQTIAPEVPILSDLAECDANGNVLGSQPYLRAVYQVFALGDGFV